MTPDFDELINEGDSPEEIAELRQVHDLLVSASPPPTLTAPPRRAPRVRRTFRGRPSGRGWTVAALGFAAAASAVIGIAIGSTLGPTGFRSGFTRPMHGVGEAVGASALIRVGKEDTNGNRPLQVTVHRLPALAEGRWYELYLTRKGKAVVPCGIFQTGGSGSARVTMNAPADLAEYDGWVVTARAPGHQARVLLTT